MSIKDYTWEELSKEFKHREKIRNNKPKVLETIDFSCVQEEIEEELQNMVEHDGESSSGMQEWLYEACFEVVYGEKIWDYINSLD